MKRSCISFVLLLTIFFLSTTASLFSQTFQHTFKGGAADSYVAGLVLYSPGNPTMESSYIAVGNTESFGLPERILLVKYATNGNVLWSRTINDPNAPLDVFHATDIAPATYNDSPGNMPPAAPTQPVTGTADVKGFDDADMYITGYTQSPGGNRRMILVRVNPSGTVLWMKNDFTPPTLDETGVSVESEPGGDVFVTGHATDNLSVSHVSAARLNSNATVTIWFNRYRLNTGQLSFAPKQSCVYQDLQQQVGLGITGTYSGTSFPFVSDAFTLRINPDGAEAWRIGCPSGGATSTGEDIMLDANNRRFIICGSSVGTTGTGAYVYQVNGGGLFFPGLTISPSQGGDLFAQGICPEANGGGNYFLTGEYKPAGSPSGNTFLMNFNPGSGAVWTRRYPLTTPNNPATESIYVKPAGYFIPTNVLDPDVNFKRDAHAMATDITGYTSVYCKAEEVATNSAVAGSRIVLTGLADPVTANDPLVTAADELVNASGNLCAPPPVSCSCMDELKINYTYTCCRPGVSQAPVLIYDLSIMDCGIPWVSKTVQWDFSGVNSPVVIGGNPNSNYVKIKAGQGVAYICVTIKYIFYDGTECEKQFCELIKPKCEPEPPLCNGIIVPRSQQTGGSSGEEVQLYPNPAGNQVTIGIPEEINPARIDMISPDGKIVASLPVNFSDSPVNMNVDVSRFTPGMYILRIFSADGILHLKKFIKE